MGILPDMTYGGPSGLLGGIPDWLREALGGGGPAPQGTPDGSPIPQSNPFRPPQPQPPQGGMPDIMGMLQRGASAAAPVAGEAGNRLLGAFQGLANGNGWLGGLANAATTLATGQPTDPASISRQNMMAQYKALIDAGLQPAQAKAAMMNPEIMKAVAPSMMPKYDFHNVDGTMVQSNPYDPNSTRVIGSVPKVQTVPDGATLGTVSAPGTVFGNPAAAPRPGGAPSFTPIQQGGVKIDDISAMRKEVTALPEVKRYSEAAPIFRSMTESHNVNTSAADLDFVYGVAKIFDPDSVVREGEMKLVGKAQSLPEDVRGFIQSVSMGGARLTPEARQRILDVAQIRMTELKNATDQRLAPYHGIADRNKINEADILPQLPQMPRLPGAAAIPGDPGMTPVVNTEEQPPTQKQLMDTAPEKTIVRIDGKRVVKQNGQWVPAQ